MLQFTTPHYFSDDNGFENHSKPLLDANHAVPIQYRNQFLPKDVRIVGYARTKMDHEEYIKRVRSHMKTPSDEMKQQLDEFCKICTYVAGQYDQDEAFFGLTKHMEELEQGNSVSNRVFYMALPPSVFIPVSQHLKKCCYPKGEGIARIIASQLLPYHSCMGDLLTLWILDREAVWQGSCLIP